MVSNLLKWLYEHPKAPLAVDTETTGLRVDDGRAVTIGASFTARIGGDLASQYIPFNHRLGKNADELTRKKLAYVLRQGRRLIFANVQFDMLALETVDIRVSEMPFYDVLTMANLVREDYPAKKSLENLYEYYVGGDEQKLKDWEWTRFDDRQRKAKVGERWVETMSGPNKGKMRKLNVYSEETYQVPRERTTLEWQKTHGWPHTTPEMIDAYACRDTEATFETCEAILRHPAWREQPASVWENKQDLIRVLVEMKRRGVAVDVDLAAELEDEGAVAKELLLEEMGGLNPSSTTDAPKIFLDILGLPVLKMTAGGKDKDPEKMKPSFTAAVLTDYDMILSGREGDNEEQRRWISNVKAWRGWTTAMGLLLRPYQERVSPDGRLRTSYTTHVTSTGRISSREPNLQQISKEGGQPWNNRIKACFLAKPGYALLSADYSQLELRLAVAYAQEPELQEIFLEGRDIFSEMAEELGWERKKTKMFVYATQYGGGAERISYIFNLKLPNGDPDLVKAKDLINQFYRKYPKFRWLNEVCKGKVEKAKKIRLWSGRIRHFRSTSDSYKAMNALLQGGAADVVERVWVHVMKTLDNEDCRCLLQVHDALVFEVREDLVEEYREKIRITMEDVNGICAPDSVEPIFPVKFAVEVSDWAEAA